MRSSQDTPPVIESEFAALRLLIFPDIVTLSDELKDSHKLQQAYEFHLNELATKQSLSASFESPRSVPWPRRQLGRLLLHGIMGNEVWNMSEGKRQTFPG